MEHIIKNNTVVINYDYLFDIDSMCVSLTHELIHYLNRKTFKD